MVEHNATCCPKLYAVLVAAESFCEDVQEDHPAIDQDKLRRLNEAIDAAHGRAGVSALISTPGCTRSGTGDGAEGGDVGSRKAREAKGAGEERTTNRGGA